MSKVEKPKKTLVPVQVALEKPVPRKNRSVKIELTKPLRKAARAEAKLEGLKLKGWVLKLINERIGPLAVPAKPPKRRAKQSSD